MNIIREWDYDENNPPNKIVSADKPLSLEIGCGNGLFLSTIASLYPQESFVGLEVKHKCLTAAQKKCERLVKENKITEGNVILLNGDVFTALDKFFEPHSLDRIYINFPDPWFKKRHLKKRIVNPDMVVKYAELLKPNGKLYFVTDNEDYRDYAVDVLHNCAAFSSEFDSPYYVTELDWYPQSLYEKKWREEGRGIYYSGWIVRSV